MAAIAPAQTAKTTTDTKPIGSSVVLLFIGLMVTMLMAAMNQTVLSTALPTIVGELGGVNEMSWVITAYILASTVTMPVYGRISDQFGRKPVLLVAIVLFIAGSIVGGLSQNIWWLVGARVLQGIGGGGLMILSQAAIADVVPARERGKYMGFLGGVFALSSVAGPLLGGWITEGPGWRWAFWINLPLGALSIVATLLFLRLPKKQRPATRARIDYVGMTVLAAATAAVVLVCTWGGHTYEWSSPQILGLIAAAVVLAVVFVLNERKADQPVIPLYLFKDRNFTITTIGALLIGTIITHRGTYSLFEITSLGFRYDRRAGNWLNIGVGDRYVTRLHLDGGFFSPPDDTQWMAMRHLLALKMQMHFRPDGQYMPPPRSDEMADVRTLFLPEHQISAGEALQIMDAQIRWVLSGKRAASAKSPMRDALLMRYVRF